MSTLVFCGYATLAGVAALVIIALVAAVEAAAGMLRDSWRNARDVIRQTEDEARARAQRDASAWRDEPGDAHTAGALTLTCRWCNTMTGSCTCPGRCGTPGCRGEWTTSLTSWTPEELAILRGEKELET